MLPRSEVSVNRTRVLHRRQLLESYLILHDFQVIPSRKPTTLRLERKADGQDYNLRIDPQWLQLATDASVRSRLDALDLIPFLLQNGSAWIVVTATGERHKEQKSRSEEGRDR